MRCQNGLRHQCHNEATYGQWWCDDCRVSHRETQRRLLREKEEFSLEERSFGPHLREIFGEDWRVKSGYEIRIRGSGFPSMAHLVHHIRAFKSIGEARRNGISGPVEFGVKFIRIGGYKHRVVIE